MNQFEYAHIAIASATHYPKWYRGKLRSVKHTDKVRGDLAVEFCKKVLNLGCKLVIVDGRSSKTFIKELHNIDKIQIFKRRRSKRSPARRLAIKIVSRLPDVKIIVLTEPEKISLLNFLPQITRPLFKDEVDIIVPKREESFFKSTYPSYMHESEIEANKLYNEALRSQGLLSLKNEDLDMFFGPRIFINNKQVISLFMKRFVINYEKLMHSSEYLDPEEYSNTLFFPIVFALKKKLRIKSLTIPFEYPKIQKENEEKMANELFIEKRKAQRLSILLNLMYLIGFIKKESASKIKQVH